MTALVLFIVLLSGSVFASGQPSPVNHDPYVVYKDGTLSPAMATVVVVVVGTLFFIGFFIVYVQYCTGARATDASINNLTRGGRRVPNAATARGLDAVMIETLPTFVYSEVKTQKIENGALECAICLNEFENDETLRLLPKCDHVFHPHCIGAWLKGHVTCPVCRTNLTEQQEVVEPVEREVIITEPNLEWQSSTVPESVTRVKFTRSHTTGHSVVSPRENTERFKLKLPEDLRKKIIENWKMNRSNSLFLLPSGKPVEPSSVRSDRWLFRKTPSFLWRGRDDGSIKLGGSSRVKENALPSPTGDSVRAERWVFFRNPSFLWRNTPIPSPRIDTNKDGEGTSSVQHSGTTGSPTGPLRLPV